MSGGTNETSCAVRLAARVAGVAPYTPPPKLAGVDLLLDANEGPPPSDAVRAALSSLDAEALRRYPDARPLRARLAAMHGVPERRVVVTGGGDDAIARVCASTLGGGRALVTHDPTFVMIPRYAGLAGGEVRRIAWSRGAFPLADMLGAIDDSVGLVSVVSPANPTGLTASLDDMRALAKKARTAGAALLADLAYAEFDDADLTRELAALPNAIVVRTFSKAYGLAGLRIGYAVCGDAGVARALDAAGGPFPVSVASLAAAGAAIDDRNSADRTANRVRSERDEVSALLRSLGIETLDSKANFIAARFRDAAFTHRALLAAGVSVRRFGAGSTTPDLLRITMPGDPAAFARLLHALRLALDPHAVLFDMDGVLADVSGSYRLAIERTCAHFGIPITQADISHAKRRGNANDDWTLTHRLICDAGVRVTLEKVVQRFQRIYLGDGNAEGARESEAPLFERSTLERLAQRGLRLGVVTGRPRDEAYWFLDRFGVRDLFGAVVTMDDTSRHKPDPEPVLLAMDRLGAARAWMVGDTVDDIAAARAAGALPVGVVAPDDDRDATGDAMAAHGGHLLIDTLDQLVSAISPDTVGATP